MGYELRVVIAAVVVSAGCGGEAEADIVGVCQPAVELELPSGDVEYNVPTFEYADGVDGGHQMTGVVDAADATYLFECETNA